MRLSYTSIFLVILSVLFLACDQQVKRTEDLVDYLPPNPEVVVKIANLETVKKDFSNSGLYHDLPNPFLHDFLANHAEFLSSFQPKYPSALSLDQSADTTHYTFVTKHHPGVFTYDSLVTPVNRLHKKWNIRTIERGGKQFFSAVIDSVFVVSSSDKLVESIIEGKLPEGDPLRKAFQLKQNTELSTIFSPKPLIIDSSQVTLGTQAVLALDILPKGVSATGVLTDKDSIPSLISIFQGLVPQKNEIARVTPMNALQVRAITFQDAELLSNNLMNFQGDSIALPHLFDAITEIGSIATSEDDNLVIRSIDPDVTREELSSNLSELSVFREVPLYQFSEETSSFERFHPILSKVIPSIVFRWEDFFVFAENEDSAKNMITAIKNGSVLEKSSAYEDAAPSLSQSSSFIVYNLNGEVDAWIAPFLGSEEGKVTKHPLISLQISNDRGFAHVNLVCKELNGSKKQVSGVVTQLFSETLEAPILSPPQLFTNHRTRGKDIVVQDIENRLYLLSSSGKVLWKKRLDGPILGSIQEVDILRNGKKQLAFATPKTFYILDRNGNAVSPFPKKFQDPITQPLSIFDYDNKRNYRFVVTQGKEIHMYDSKGKTVTGFTFKKTASDIVLPPQHVRMRTKDYLIIAEESGKLNILSRVGKERVRVSKTFDFSNIPIAKEGDNFVVITKKGTKETISQTGKVTSQSLQVSDNYQFRIHGNTKVTLDDNLLRVNGKLVELPYGIYTAPRIFNSNQGVFIAVTETQEKKLYVLDKSGSLVDGFPIYGGTTADIAIVKGRLLVTTGVEENEIAAYSL